MYMHHSALAWRMAQHPLPKTSLEPGDRPEFLRVNTDQAHLSAT